MGGGSQEGWEKNGCTTREGIKGRKWKGREGGREGGQEKSAYIVCDGGGLVGGEQLAGDGGGGDLDGLEGGREGGREGGFEIWRGTCLLVPSHGIR